MKVEAVIDDLKRKNLLDDSNIFVYASEKRIIGGAVGASYGPVLLSVYQDTL